MKLPFPLTPQFKAMLQSGVGTRDLDVRWVSSLSWYFLTLFGLQPVYNFILGSNNGRFLHSIRQGDSPAVGGRYAHLVVERIDPSQYLYHLVCYGISLRSANSHVQPQARSRSRWLR